MNPPSPAFMPTLAGDSADAKPALSTGPALVSQSAAKPATPGDQRYQQRSLLGQGGMGEVLLCRDVVIGRDVALKRAHPRREGLSDGPERFLREARVQGQLEHPAVVPVYDLAVDGEGRLFFTMKRVRGTTLEAILDGLRGGDEAMKARFSRRKLLQAFSTVCLAVDFAHQRGVLHRDLKPANIMLGDYGEVYVLDWGLAKLAGEGEPSGQPGDAVREHDHGSAPGQTVEGIALGTPGYMSPEQVRGEMQTLTAAADVYALGAILFEILALSHLHRGDTALQLMFSTERGVDGRPSTRAPVEPVPPELDDLCQRATAHDPAGRVPTARALQEALERYLDGDRDLARRRALAEEFARAAAADATRALGAGSDDEVLAARARALRAAGQALALDPGYAPASQVILRLLTTPPQRPPKAALEAQTEASQESVRRALRFSGLMYAGWVLILPLMAWCGIRDYDWFAITWSTLVVSGLVNQIAGRVHGRDRRLDHGLAALSILGNVLAVLCAGHMFGPIIFAPGIAVVTVLAFAIHPEPWARFLGPLCGALAFVVPAILGFFGIGGPLPYLFEQGRMQILPNLHALPPDKTPIMLFLSGVGMVVTASCTIGHVRSGLSDAERALHVQTWQLRQLLPDPSAADAPPTSAADDHRGAAQAAVGDHVGQADR